MPGIELLDYTRGDQIIADQRDAIVEIVHDILEEFNKKRPKHTSFRYTPAKYLDASFIYNVAGELDDDGYDYILVVDGEKTQRTMELKKEIREAIKAAVADLLNIREEDIAVRYRVYDSSFG